MVPLLMIALQVLADPDHEQFKQRKKTSTDGPVPLPPWHLASAGQMGPQRSCAHTLELRTENDRPPRRQNVHQRVQKCVLFIRKEYGCWSRPLGTSWEPANS